MSKPYSDKERLDWLSELTTFSYQEFTNPRIGSPDFDKIEKRQLFTIPSQHVCGQSARDAIDEAIDKSKANPTP